MIRLATLAAVLAVVACGSHRLAGSPSRAPNGYVAIDRAGPLAYWVVGSGRDTVVVLHGFQGHGHGYLGADLASLASSERTLIFYDQRGDGRSAPVANASTLSLETHVADLEAVRRHFHLGRLALLAHSGGAAIALRYAERQPARVARILLIAPLPPARVPYGEETARAFAPRLDSTTRARAAALAASLPTASDPSAVCRAIAAAVVPRAYFADPGAAAQMRGDFCTGAPEAIRAQPERLAAFQRSLPADWRPSASAVRAPVLILHGDHDSIPVAAAEAWARVLPEARLLVVTGADHLPWVEQPARVFAAASEFFAGRWPSGATIVR